MFLLLRSEQGSIAEIDTDRELNFYSGLWTNYFLSVRGKKFTSSGASVEDFFTRHGKKIESVTA